MSRDIQALMELRFDPHWTERSLCSHDPRFTGKREWLDGRDVQEMKQLCMVCPVFTECHVWSSDPNVTDVFAAGTWQFPVNQLGESDEP